jgi:hypothetical protein
VFWTQTAQNLIDDARQEANNLNTPLVDVQPLVQIPPNTVVFIGGDDYPHFHVLKQHASDISSIFYLCLFVLIIIICAIVVLMFFIWSRRRTTSIYFAENKNSNNNKITSETTPLIP